MIHFSGSKLLWLMMILECVVAKTQTFRITKRRLVPLLMLLYCACPLHKTLINWFLWRKISKPTLTRAKAFVVVVGVGVVVVVVEANKAKQARIWICSFSFALRRGARFDGENEKMKAKSYYASCCRLHFVTIACHANEKIIICDWEDCWVHRCNLCIIGIYIDSLR